jgi:uncharacterized cupredoxin-like copper-binding protein
MKTPVLPLVAVVAMALSAAPALAHGNKPHAGGAVTKVQTEWGIAADRIQARRSIEVAMGDDMRFRPERIELRLGETVRFVVRNKGRQMHEFVIGTRAENRKHAELMLKHPGMEHDEPWMAHVEPGRAGEIVWTFNRAGEFEFACLIAGHYQAGMVGTIRVAAAAPR